MRRDRAVSRRHATALEACRGHAAIVSLSKVREEPGRQRPAAGRTRDIEIWIPLRPLRGFASKLKNSARERRNRPSDNASCQPPAANEKMLGAVDPARPLARCDGCAYFRAGYELTGTCHRYPPAFAGDQSPREDHHWRFPCVMSKAWCGEFAPRRVPEPR